MGWKICFCARPAFWMGDQKKKEAKLIFISKVERSFEAHTNAFKWYLVIYGMSKHTKSILISSLLPKVEAPPDCSEKLHAWEMDGCSSLLQQERKILITEWKNSARGVPQPPATLAFNDYPKFGKQQYDFSILFIFKKQVLVDPSGFKTVLKNLTLQRPFLFQLRNLQALLVSLQLTYVECW